MSELLTQNVASMSEVDCLRVSAHYPFLAPLGSTGSPWATSLPLVQNCFLWPPFKFRMISHSKEFLYLTFLDSFLKDDPQLYKEVRPSFPGSKFMVRRETLSHQFSSVSRQIVFYQTITLGGGSWGMGRASPNADGVPWFWYASLLVRPVFCFPWTWSLTTQVSRRKPSAVIHGCCQFHKLLFQFTFSKHLLDTSYESLQGQWWMRGETWGKVNREGKGCFRWDWTQGVEGGDEMHSLLLQRRKRPPVQDCCFEMTKPWGGL
jgi:hypothetical protein